jgi:hypothetical protein
MGINKQTNKKKKGEGGRLNYQRKEETDRE